MTSRFLSILIAILISLTGFSQVYNYVHYDYADGLAGSTVYDMTQDTDGFMWFATENGVSRFDGVRFANFTVKNGLPDNEVLKLFADSKGRVWFGSLGKELSFYYKGVIHNKQNDSLLLKKEMQVSGFSFAEDRNGNFYISDYKKLVKTNKNDQSFQLTDSPDFKIRTGRNLFLRTNIYEKLAIVEMQDSIFELQNASLKLFYTTHFDSKHLVGIKILPPGAPVLVKLSETVFSETMYGPTSLFLNTTNGAWSIDTTKSLLDEQFLPGKHVSKTMIDSEGNTWFSTIGDGIYKLTSHEMKTFNLGTGKDQNNKEVFSIAEFNGSIAAGLGFSNMALIKDYKIQEVINYSKFLNQSHNAIATNRLYTIFADKDKSLYLGFDAFLLKLNNGLSKIQNIISIKSITELDDDHILLGNYATAIIVRKSDLSIVDTIRLGRCTDAVCQNGNYYFGTMDGLYKMDKQRSVINMGKQFPELSRRVISIKKGIGNKLFVATADNGLAIINNDTLVHVINEKTGASSNICKSLFVDSDYVWLGTNKGIDKISINNPEQKINYSSADGLPSNIINGILVKDNIVWVATPQGLTYFSENKIKNISSCNLIVLKVDHNGDSSGVNGLVVMPFKENSINFQFTGISQKSAGGVEYYYKLSGIDTAFKKSIANELFFFGLPPGVYHLSLYAVNKFGKRSNLYEYDFSIKDPFWKTWWFYLGVLLSVATITSLIVLRQNRRNRKRLEEKNEFQRQLASLEQQTLQSQMNPHFIFNCLNSIQQFILTNEQNTANEYLSEFAQLIEQTLDISSKPSIPIKQEVAYLTKYLEMEKMRFGNNFKYNITIEPTLLESKVNIPSLLLQPYVENSIRHGLRYKEGGIGMVQLKFIQHENMLYCHVIDNGIGRQRSFELKAGRHIEYQSKGMQLTAKRMRLINLIEDRELQAEILDHVDSEARPVGTEVIVKIPIS